MDPLAAHSDILEKRCFGSVSTLRPDGRLSCVPVSIMWDADGLWFSSVSTTKKIRNLREDPRIALAILDPDNPGRYVEVRGRARVDDDPDRKFVNRVAQKFMDVDEYPYDAAGTARVVVTVDVEVVSAPNIPGA